ncbi:MAG: DNA-binding protein [Desulfurococcales archaeon ex4484_58]|nr:MAG: DNA-binding protein [Desulfurococcales archaeon ex4484_58]
MLFNAGVREVKKYFDEIIRGVAEGYLCEVNFAEFYYKSAEKLGLETTDILYEAIRNSPIKQIPVEGELTREAGRVKMRYRDKISIADAFLIALTYQVKGIALTTDPVIKEILRDKCRLFKV